LAGGTRMTLILNAYRAASSLAAPGLRLWLRRRNAAGREDPARLMERFGIASAPRPEGRLVWVHAASVGETVSVLPVIAALVPEAKVLLTTGTLTSASLAAARLPPGAIHQFAPLDIPAWIGGFLTHWHPDAAIFVESELWPNMLAALASRRVPTALVNGRMSTRSGARWRMLPATSRAVLRRFRWIAAQSKTDEAAFRQLGGLAVTHPGNLKFSAPAPPDDPPARAALAACLPGPVWLAAATHPGEDEHILAAHRSLIEEFPDLATIIVPRHPARGPAIAALAADLPVSCRSFRQNPRPGGIHIADTLGELGIFYRLCRIAFIGGSLVPIGGHNMLEAAKLGCAVLTGPHTANFIEPMAVLRYAGGVTVVQEGARLPAVLRVLLRDPAQVAVMGEAGRNAANRFADLPAALAARILGLIPA
jgi:3-deoxy-D-manno-octulosonic-acid transferase